MKSGDHQVIRIHPLGNEWNHECLYKNSIIIEMFQSGSKCWSDWHSQKPCCKKNKTCRNNECDISILLTNMLFWSNNAIRKEISDYYFLYITTILTQFHWKIVMKVIQVIILVLQSHNMMARIATGYYIFHFCSKTHYNSWKKMNVGRQST